MAQCNHQFFLFFSSSLYLFNPQEHSPTSGQLLFILVDSYRFAILRYDPANKAIIAQSTGNLQERVGTKVQQPKITFDHQSRCIILYLYSGLLRIVPLDSHGLIGSRPRSGITSLTTGVASGLKTFNLRVRETHIRSLCVLKSNSPNPLIAILNDSHGITQISTYYIDISGKMLIGGPININVEFAAHTILPCLIADESIIIFSPSSIVFTSKEVKKHIDIGDKPPLEKNTVIDDNRLFCSDGFGNLYILFITPKFDITLTHIGITSIASSLSWLGGGLLFVGSSFGDSQFISIQQDSIVPISSWTNIGPIVDFQLTQTMGRPQIVTCSGAFQDGSLRVVRNGMGTFEVLSKETSAQSIFPFLFSHLQWFIFSFPSKTEVYQFTKDTNTLISSSLDNVILDEKTIFASQVIDTYLIQVTPTCINIISSNPHKLSTLEILKFCKENSIDYVDSLEENENSKSQTHESDSDESDSDTSSITLNTLLSSSSSNKITHSHCTKDNQNIIISIGSYLILLSLPNLQIQKSILLKSQISCISISPTTNSHFPFLVSCGCWDKSIHLFDHNLNLLASITASALPRSLDFGFFSQIHQQDDHFLICGLGDGQLVSLRVKPFKHQLQQGASLIKELSVTLGSQPLGLTQFRLHNKLFFLTISDRPTLIHYSNNHFVYTALHVPSIRHICHFGENSIAYITSIDFSIPNSTSQLRIDTLSPLEKLHVQTFPLKAMPRRICYSKPYNLYFISVLSQQFVPQDMQVRETCRILCVNGTSFAQKPVYELKENEDVESLLMCSIGSVEYLFVGTCFIFANESHPRLGRLLVFVVQKQPHNSGQLNIKLVQELRCSGGVYALAKMDVPDTIATAGKISHPSLPRIIASANDKIFLYNWSLSSNTPLEPEEEEEEGVTGSSSTLDNPLLKEQQSFFLLADPIIYYGHIMTLHLACFDNFILIGDLLKSITLVCFDPVKKLIYEVERDYYQHWLSAMTIIDKSTFLGADTSRNFYVLEKPKNVTTQEDKGSLKLAGHWNLGDQVNKFHSGTLVYHLDAHFADTFTSEKKISSTLEDTGSEPGNESDSGKSLALNKSARSIRSRTGDTISDPYSEKGSTSPGFGPSPDSPDAFPNKLAQKSFIGRPTHVFATIGGGIGVIASLDRPSFDFLHNLEAEMNKQVTPLGNFPHSDYRSFSNQYKTAKAFNFIDGDFLEQFISLDIATQTKIASNLEYPCDVSTIQRIVEGISRLYC